MKFVKYSSIENAYRTKFIQKLQMYMSKEEFVVQEKIHGANSANILDGEF